MFTDRITRRLHIVPIIFGSLILLGAVMYFNINTFADKQPWYKLVAALTLSGMVLAQYMVPVICIEHTGCVKRVLGRIVYWVVFVVSSGLLLAYLDAVQRYHLK